MLRCQDIAKRKNLKPREDKKVILLFWLCEFQDFFFFQHNELWFLEKYWRKKSYKTRKYTCQIWLLSISCQNKLAFSNRPCLKERIKTYFDFSKAFWHCLLSKIAKHGPDDSSTKQGQNRAPVEFTNSALHQAVLYRNMSCIWYCSCLVLVSVFIKHLSDGKEFT